ncbi:MULTISPECIES: ABC transporter ATP-binding protein [Staphylococcus]|uniref:ATP-binding cassette domain-containing protein n=1 Tax=Staphylococcus hsinchuensis TaxID=3051183 RepID=A0ABZ3EDF4_9STAP|nr:MULTISPECIES: ATP-binding cassette domain-containing protein [unclassified Staphylococcus]
MLEMRNVSYEVDNQRIIKGIDLKVSEGDTIAIVGPSGSGKSTLFRLMNHLISPTDGTITFEGKRYEDIQPEQLRRSISYLLQESDLFDKTIGENLAFPSVIRGETFDKSRASSLLDAVGLGHYEFDKRVEHLSGGERQRITIARQLMYKPKVLLLDEATSALDTANRDKIERLIFDLADEGVAMLWITHSNDQSIRHFKRRIQIVDGQIDKEESLR